jgi:hypothetical protein
LRYLAQRIGTGEWLDRDLPLVDVERTVTLSGPGSITATVNPEMWRLFHSDGLRLLEGWATYLYVEDDNHNLTDCGIVLPPISYEGEATTLTAAGVATYPHGYLYDSARLWGPSVGTGTTAAPQFPAPDPIRIVQDHWNWIQSRPDSNLGVTLVGDLSSTTRVGTFEEPYRLNQYEYPDLGQQIDDLATQTPFDYVEEHAWASEAQLAAVHQIRLGFPRLGTRRDDLRFADGENIGAVVAATTPEDYANDVIGIGRGAGTSMVVSRSTVSDGRLRRTKVLTNKTATQAAMNTATLLYQQKLSANTLDVGALTVIDHPNAPLSDIDLGDDVFVQTEIPAYGNVALWLRVIGITRSDNPQVATLTTQRSTSFIYNTVEELSS